MYKYIDFSPFGNSAIELEFKCNECHNTIKTEQFGLPHPNYMAEKASDSYVDREEFVICENCQKEFIIDINVGYADAYVSIIGLKEENEVIITEIPEEYDDYYMDEQIDSFLYSENPYSNFIDEMHKLKELNKLSLNNNELEKTLKRQIYSSTITCLEDYLSTTLINNVLNDNILFRKFVETYENFKKEKFSLNQIFIKREQLESKVKEHLLGIIYHNLRIVKGIYETTFDIKFPDINEVMKIVINRHHMVHRNGKDKDGNEIILDINNVNDVIYKVEEFIKKINLLLTNNINKEDDELPW
jgi:hypothetical protein